MSKQARSQLRAVPDLRAGGPAAEPILLTGERRRRAFLRRLARMNPEQRLAAARSGAFSRAERTAWAVRYPEEVPLVNGEIEWIALRLADLD